MEPFQGSILLAILTPGWAADLVGLPNLGLVNETPAGFGADTGTDLHLRISGRSTRGLTHGLV